MIPAFTVTLYGREGCHLCDDAKALLDGLATELGFRVEDVDIESDDALLKRYMLEIPVIAIGGQEIARAPISANALRDRLAEHAAALR